MIATKPAATANHFSCSRASPAELLNRRITETNAAISETGNAINENVKAMFAISRTTPGTLNGSPDKGRSHVSVATIIVATINAPPAVAASHAIGRHRRERRAPSGNVSSRMINMVKAIGHTHLPNHPRKRTKGHEACATRRAWTV